MAILCKRHSFLPHSLLRCFSKWGSRTLRGLYFICHGHQFRYWIPNQKKGTLGKTFSFCNAKQILTQVSHITPFDFHSTQKETKVNFGIEVKRFFENTTNSCIQITGRACAFGPLSFFCKIELKLCLNFRLKTTHIFFQAMNSVQCTSPLGCRVP